MKWPMVSFIETCDIQGGTQPPKSTFVEEPTEGYVRLLQIQDFKRDDKAVFVPDKKTLKKCFEQDILIGRYGASVGKILTGKSGAYNVALVKTVPNLDVLDRGYLYHYLCSPIFQNYILNVGSRAAQAGFNKDDLAGVEIPLPSLGEQKRIAAILDKADAIRRKRQQAIQLADEFLRSVFLNMFGDPVTNPKGWEVKPLVFLCNKITDGTHHSPPIVESGIPYITAKHLKKTGLEFHSKPWYVSEENHQNIYSRCNPEPNDVLYIKDGATTGIAAINEYDFEFSMLSSLALLKPNYDLINSEFLCMFLNHPRTKSVLTANMAGAAITRLTLAKIKDVKVPLPDLQCQNKFKAIYDLVRVLLRKINASEDMTEQKFNSLSQKAFYGEL